MASQGDALSKKLERVKKSVQKLPAASSTLNQATDQLGKSIGELDATLKTFNLGVPTWVKFAGWEDVPDYYHEYLGYAKIGGKWGIAIRTVSGNLQYQDQDEVEQWLFNDAPRLHRVNAVENIPELLEELLESAGRMAKTITEKSHEIDLLTAGIRDVIDSSLKSKVVTTSLERVKLDPTLTKKNTDEKGGK